MTPRDLRDLAQPSTPVLGRAFDEGAA